MTWRVPRMNIGIGTQKVVIAISDLAGNVGIVTNTIEIGVYTNVKYYYSAAGCVTNMTSRGTIGLQERFDLTWDWQYRLTQVNRDTQTVETYRYDALDRRYSIGTGAVTNYLIYDGPHVIAETDATGGLRRVYTYGPGIDNILAMTVYTGATVKTYYYLTDLQGTVNAVADGNGTVVEHYRYDAWGRILGVYNGSNQLLSVSAIGNRFLWQGREYSWTTGLYYFRARWYDPVIGRFISKDPIGISGGLNEYVAFANNPVNLTDPDGLKTRFFYGEGHAWVEITDSPYAGTYGYGATQQRYLYWNEHPILGFPGAIYNKGQFYHPDPFRSKYTQDDVCEKNTTQEQEKKLVDEMQKWVDENSYMGIFNDCYDFTEHFQQRAIDLIQVDQVKHGQMGLWKHIGSRLGRHLTPNRHNVF
jgi:RHS repeat-associated protein